jgi:predicted nucleic acid-binding protein
LVLDTNTVLDWLVFGDVCMRAVAAAVEGGKVRWLACSRMRDELSRTLNYPALERWKPDSEHTLTRFDRWSVVVDAPAPSPLDLRCADTDDQVFIDLALATGARWLLSHDRAVLRLARRAARAGLVIQKPGAWSPP